MAEELRRRARFITPLGRPGRLVTLAGLALLAWGCGPRWKLTPPVPPPAPVQADSGMVVAAHPLAAEAGVAVLREGGNAVDAALAALLMLNVVEPHASGLGGGGFALVRTPDGQTAAVIYRERAPKALDTAFYCDPADTDHVRMSRGGSAVCVPGAAAGWAELYDRWATLPWERLAEDAIRTATEGFPVDPTLAGQISGNLEKITADSILARTFLKDGIIPLSVGDTLRQPELARTLQILVERGLRSFYRGPLAEAVVEASRRGGGFISDDDLAFYRPEVVSPLEAEWRDYRVLTVPAPSSGGVTLLEALYLFDRCGVNRSAPSSAESIHLMAQCLQQSYADADALVQDDVPIDRLRRLISPEHLSAAEAGISVKTKAQARRAVAAAVAASPGNTTHLVVVDRWGGVVSLTQSINWFFGAGLTAPGTGVILNNQMADFSLPPDSVNLLRPRVRPRSNMTPLIILKGERPIMALGTPGGARIASTTAQIVYGVMEYARDISTAIDYPRFFTSGSHLVLESRFPKEVVKRLHRRGYILHLAGPYHNYFGGAHGILVRDGKLFGAADRRRGGAARGY